MSSLLATVAHISQELSGIGRADKPGCDAVTKTAASPFDRGIEGAKRFEYSSHLPAADESTMFDSMGLAARALSI